MGKKEDSNRPESKTVFGFTRRTFLKLSGFAAAAVFSRLFPRLPAFGSSSPLPDNSEGVITEKWLPTSCLNCTTRCGTLVRVVNGKAVRVTGNPLSQVSEGETCPRAHIGLQVLYDEGRVSRPLKRTNPGKGKGVDPQWTPVSWDEALGEIGTRLKTLRDNGQPQQLALFTGLNTISDEDLIKLFAEAYGTPNVIPDDGLDGEADKAGQWLADGNYTRSAYDLANTNYILSFGASILESEKPLARNLRMWGKIHRERPNRVKVVVIDPRYSVTAAKADRWLPINPGTDAALAMSLASVIISEKLYDADFVNNRTAGFAEYGQLATSRYQPEQVAGITGIPAETIREIAREFAATRPAIAWRGRGATSWPGGSYTSYAIFCLNALVGSIDIPGGVTYQENPAYRDLPEITEDETAKSGNRQPRIDLAHTEKFPLAVVATNQVADSVIAGTPYPVSLAIGFNSNFNMTAPAPRRWETALAKIPFYVHISPFPDEMAEYADILLPATTFLEQWAYDHSPPGSGFAEVKIKQPVVTPLGEARSVADIIFSLAGSLGGTVARSFSGIGNNAAGFVQYRTAPFQSWQKFIENGVWVGPAYRYYKYDRIFKTPSGKFEFRSGNLEKALQSAGLKTDSLSLLPHYQEAGSLGAGNEYPLRLSVYQPVLDVENGSQNYPWAQEFYLVQHGRGWDNFAEINTRTARALGIRDGDTVWVESPLGKLRVKVRVFEGVHPGVVSIALGQGHNAYGRWAKNIGVNPNEIIGVDYDRLSGQASFFNTRVKVYRA